MGGLLHPGLLYGCTQMWPRLWDLLCIYSLWLLLDGHHLSVGLTSVTCGKAQGGCKALGCCGHLFWFHLWIQNVSNTLLCFHYCNRKELHALMLCFLPAFFYYFADIGSQLQLTVVFWHVCFDGLGGITLLYFYKINSLTSFCRWFSHFKSAKVSWKWVFLFLSFFCLLVY